MWAPDYDVPENVSPFKPLPILTRCTGCRTPLETFETYSVVRGGRPIATGLCGACAEERRG